MPRRNRVPEPREGRPSERPTQGGSFLPPSFLSVASLAGIAVLIFMSLKQGRETQQFQDGLDKISDRVSTLSSKVDNYAKTAGAPRQQGPDPNKVYTVKTHGSPMEGSENAVITIAEFSDFQ